VFLSTWVFKHIFSLIGGTQEEVMTLTGLSGECYASSMEKFSTDVLSRWLKPIVYKISTKGGKVLYIGASAYGLGRPLSCNHRLYMLLHEYKLAVDLEVQYFDTANEAFAEELRLIAGLKPLLNFQPVSEIPFLLDGLQRRED
jgi:hypothetical protein